MSLLISLAFMGGKAPKLVHSWFFLINFGNDFYIDFVSWHLRSFKDLEPLLLVIIFLSTEFIKAVHWEWISIFHIYKQKLLGSQGSSLLEYVVNVHSFFPQGLYF